MCCVGKRGNGDVRGAHQRSPEHWDGICISFATLATAILAGLFTLIGFYDIAIGTSRIWISAIMTGGVAIVVYFVVLGYVYYSLFRAPADQKQRRTGEVARLFMTEALAVAVTVVFVVWAISEPAPASTPSLVI